MESLVANHDEDLSEAKNKENALNMIDDLKAGFEDKESSLDEEKTDLFKRMLSDEDNISEVVVYNEFINLRYNLGVKSYRTLPKVLKEKVKEGCLSY